MQAKEWTLFLRVNSRRYRRLFILICLLCSTSLALAADGCDPLKKEFDRTPLPEKASYHNELGIWFAGKGEKECALQSFLTAVATESSSWEANYNAGRMYIELGNLTSGARLLARAVALRPDAIESRLAYGEAVERLSQTGRAEQVYRDGLNLDPQSPLLYANLARLMGKKGSINRLFITGSRPLHLIPKISNIAS